MPGEIVYELLDPDRDDAGAPGPEPRASGTSRTQWGDLFFDIEGARYYSEDAKEFGLQYLFGIVDTADLDADGPPKYTQIWASTGTARRRRSKSSSTSSQSGGRRTRAFTCTTTTTTSRHPSTT